MIDASSPSNKLNVWVVIAAYNEGEVLAKVVREVLGNGYSCVVVDDGPADTTSIVAASAGAHVLRHLINLGQGAALQTGIEYAVKNDAAVVVTFDADGQHDASEIDRIVSALKQQQADIALGSRFIGRTVGLSRMRAAMLKLAVMFTWATTGVRLTDAHNGFRALTRDVAQRLQLEQNRMAHASEMISFIGANNLRVVEVPVTIIYTEYSIRKGQKLINMVNILIDLLLGRISR